MPKSVEAPFRENDVNLNGIVEDEEEAGSSRHLSRKTLGRNLEARRWGLEATDVYDL